MMLLRGQTFRLSGRSLVSQATCILRRWSCETTIVCLTVFEQKVGSVIYYAKQAMGKGKSGPVETRLTGPVGTALLT